MIAAKKERTHFIFERDFEDEEDTTTTTTTSTTTTTPQSIPNSNNNNINNNANNDLKKKSTKRTERRKRKKLLLQQLPAASVSVQKKKQGLDANLYRKDEGNNNETKTTNDSVDLEESIDTSRDWNSSYELTTTPEKGGGRHSLVKYKSRKYQLFSLFDEGIQMDEESWYSVTPECIAKHTAYRAYLSITNTFEKLCKCGCSLDDKDSSSSTTTTISSNNNNDNNDINDNKNNNNENNNESSINNLTKKITVLDAFCGVGGNSIQFALHNARVIAIDIDPQKIEFAKNNAKVYGVFESIQFFVGDFLELSKNFQNREIDIVYLSPPWGGPGYQGKHRYNLENMVPDGFEIFQHANSISPNVIYFLPRNINVDQLLELAPTGGDVEIETNSINGFLKSVTAYYGKTIIKK